MPLTIGVPRESDPYETRVALTPDIAGKLIQAGHTVLVESKAGAPSFNSDADFEAAGATITDRNAAFSAQVVAVLNPPTPTDTLKMPAGTTLIGMLKPLDDLDAVQRLAAQGVTSLSMELVPRITRAQRMDALSAMSAVGGYQAVLIAARALPKFFPLLTTAAGTIRPAKVLILGAGVSGLQAIATARRLGAVVSAYDIRPAVKEEVQSLGAKFVELDLETADAAASSGYAKALDEDRSRRQLELLKPHIAQSDVVIATALIPGRPAPLLITAEAVEAMTPGSVIVDLAAPNGGNCALTEPGEAVLRHGVQIRGVLNLPAEMPLHASQMYARTLQAALNELAPEGDLHLDLESEIIGAMCVTHAGEIVHERVKGKLGG
ncbi:MAG: Re/Si-specific NAD(P)(+) transhydrogenase subunit alpha [Bacteroidota bacterium]